MNYRNFRMNKKILFLGKLTNKKQIYYREYINRTQQWDVYTDNPSGNELNFEEVRFQYIVIKREW